MGKSQEPQEDFRRRKTPSDVLMSSCCPLPPHCLVTATTTAHSSPDMLLKQVQERRVEGVQPATLGTCLCSSSLGKGVETGGGDWRTQGYFLVQE